MVAENRKTFELFGTSVAYDPSLTYYAIREGHYGVFDVESALVRAIGDATEADVIAFLENEARRIEGGAAFVRNGSLGPISEDGEPSGQVQERLENTVRLFRSIAATLKKKE